MTLRSLALILPITTLLLACGGGGGSSSVEEPTPSATTTTETIGTTEAKESPLVGQVDLLFLGDSILQQWTIPPTSFSTKNLGISGITAKGLQDVMLDPEHSHRFSEIDPSVIYLSIGLNDLILAIRDYEPPEVGVISSYWYDTHIALIRDITYLVWHLHTVYPHAEIILTDIFPSPFLDQQNEQDGIFLGYVEIINRFLEEMPNQYPYVSFMTLAPLTSIGFHHGEFITPGEFSTLQAEPVIGHLNLRGYEVYSHLVLCEAQERFVEEVCAYDLGL